MYCKYALIVEDYEDGTCGYICKLYYDIIRIKNYMHIACPMFLEFLNKKKSL